MSSTSSAVSPASTIHTHQTGKVESAAICTVWPEASKLR